MRLYLVWPSHIFCNSSFPLRRPILFPCELALLKTSAQFLFLLLTHTAVWRILLSPSFLPALSYIHFLVKRNLAFFWIFQFEFFAPPQHSKNEHPFQEYTTLNFQKKFLYFLFICRIKATRITGVLIKRIFICLSWIRPEVGNVTVSIGSRDFLLAHGP